MNKQAVAQELVKIAGLLSEMRVLRKQTLGDYSKYTFELPVVKKGTISALNAWARAQGFKWIRDQSLFGGHWADPVTGEAYMFDTM